MVTISDTTYQAVVSGFSYEVDADDFLQTGSLTTNTSTATAVTFAEQFNTVPVVTFTILNAQAGDDVILTAVPTSSGFTVEVLNSGSNVARNLTYNAQGW